MRAGVALRSLLASLCGGALLLILGLSTRAEDAVKGNPKIRVGVAGSIFRDAPAPLVNALMKPFKSLLDSQTGINGQMVAAGDAEDLGKQLADDKVQLGVFHGFEFAWAHLKHPELKPLIITVNPSSCCRANVVILKDGAFKELADLKGKVLAIPINTREHCHLFIERRCLSAGQPMQRFFEKVTTPADMEDALDGVVDGLFGAAVVDGAVLENYAKRKPGRANKLKTLLQSEPFPPAVVACSPANLDEAIQKRFAEGMINAAESSKGQRLLTICRITGFETIPAGFEKELSRIAKAYPPPSVSGDK